MSFNPISRRDLLARQVDARHVKRAELGDFALLAQALEGAQLRPVGEQGVAQHDRELTPADLPSMAGAVVMNSWTPGVAVHRFGTATLPDASSFVALLHRAYEQEVPVAP